ncbi:caspase family protein [Geobacter sp. AOG2]|uniref:caspase family protein n=1 Tax=Geobacter sp. AOG2 TaxID=1566347 RepID=UPI001CC69D8C|nr:caspase family protein [Geobacter sp. AOG2]GFE59539.1 hypothetical protein AOG2_01270 [Geobacter sp. AOG2]
MKAAALIIGNGNYPKSKIRNPKNDATDLSNVLSSLGFHVDTCIDATVEEMDSSLNELAVELEGYDVGLFFFAGHGLQISGENYLAAINTNFTKELDVKYSSLALNKIIETMEKSQVRTIIIILDACRNNPFERAWNRSIETRGLAPVYAPKGTIIAFATSPGETASDGSGRNGAYTSGLLQHITDMDIPIEELFKRVRNTVSTITDGKQTSWEHTSLMGSFYFNTSFPDSRKITVYSDSTIKDASFTCNAANKCHDVIRELKSLNYYRQNPAISKLSRLDLSGFDKNTLFVLGRNIYQSACGGSNSAAIYLQDISSRLAEYGSEISFHVVNGMLFEVYFDSNGNFRSQAKYGMFNELMRLEDVPEYRDSFSFIHGKLLDYMHLVFYMPGLKRDVVVNICTTQNEDNETVLKSVSWEDHNIFSIGEAYSSSKLTKRMLYQELTCAQFILKLAEKMATPICRLITKFYPDLSDEVTIHAPYDFTVRKP